MSLKHFANMQNAICKQMSSRDTISLLSLLLNLMSHFVFSPRFLSDSAWKKKITKSGTRDEFCHSSVCLALLFSFRGKHQDVIELSSHSNAELFRTFRHMLSTDRQTYNRSQSTSKRTKTSPRVFPKRIYDFCAIFMWCDFDGIQMTIWHVYSVAPK